MNDLKKLTEELPKLHFVELVDSFETYLDLKTNEALDFNEELNFLLTYQEQLKNAADNLEDVERAIFDMHDAYRRL